MLKKVAIVGVTVAVVVAVIALFVVTWRRRRWFMMTTKEAGSNREEGHALGRPFRGTLARPPF